MSDVPEHKKLSCAGLAVEIGAVNNELKCAVLGMLPVEETITSVDVHKKLIVDANGGQLTANLEPITLGRITLGMPQTLVETEFDPQKRVYLITKTKAGEEALSLGGMIMKVCEPSSMPVRHLTGENNSKVANEANEGPGGSTLNSRLALFSIFHSFNPDQWQPGHVFLEEGARQGLTHSQVRSQLQSLVVAKLAQRSSESKRTLYQGHWERKFRTAPDDGLLEPVVVIEGYLEAAINYLHRDPTSMEEGREYIDRILGDTVRLPYIIRRSVISSGHAGKGNQRKAKLA